MSKRNNLTKVIFIALLALCTCIDPYYQKITRYESLLVVDGLITDEDASYSVRLSRTIQQQDAAPSEVSDASVYITDDAGNSSYLKSVGNGKYRTDSTLFRGQVGRTYILHIKTAEGVNYESAPCLMSEVPDIDSLYFEKDQELFNNGTENLDGIRIYLDSKPGDNSTYYRWEYDETWKFKVPDPSKARYISENNIVSITDYNEFCWKSNKSSEILIHPLFTGEGESVRRQPVLFIASEKSDRLLIQYSILVKQYSISGSGYEFWNRLNQVSESGSDIFAAQPYSVESNIHNPDNPDDIVLGYFQVSSVKKRRLDVSLKDIVAMDLPFYHYPCKRVATSPNDPVWSHDNPPKTFDQIYEIYISFGFIFIEPKYFPETSVLDEIIFVKEPECNNCEVTGTSVKPDFWVDLN